MHKPNHMKLKPGWPV